MAPDKLSADKDWEQWRNFVLDNIKTMVDSGKESSAKMDTVIGQLAEIKGAKVVERLECVEQKVANNSEKIAVIKTETRSSAARWGAISGLIMFGLTLLGFLLMYGGKSG